MAQSLIVAFLFVLPLAMGLPLNPIGKNIKVPVVRNGASVSAKPVEQKLNEILKPAVKRIMNRGNDMVIDDVAPIRNLIRPAVKLPVTVEKSPVVKTTIISKDLHVVKPATHAAQPKDNNNGDYEYHMCDGDHGVDKPVQKVPQPEPTQVRGDAPVKPAPKQEPVPASPEPDPEPATLSLISWTEPWMNPDYLLSTQEPETTPEWVPGTLEPVPETTTPEVVPELVAPEEEPVMIY